ncbi:MAG: hypothetical protein ACRDTR_01075 [Rubrobacter sp.]
MVVLAFLMLGCGGETNRGESREGPGPGDEVREPAVPPAQEPTEVIVTSDDASLPEGCHPGQVAELVVAFVDAFNSGDRERLSRIFFVSEGPSPPDFSESDFEPWSWYTVSKVGASGKIDSGFVTYDQGELLRYFARRHNRGEQLRLLKVSLTQRGLLGSENNVGFVYVLTRRASDLEPGLGGPAGIASGEGAVNCPNRRIFAWRMDMRKDDQRTERDAAAWLCADPPGWKPGEAVVACT